MGSVGFESGEDLKMSCSNFCLYVHFTTFYSINQLVFFVLFVFLGIFLIPASCLCVKGEEMGVLMYIIKIIVPYIQHTCLILGPVYVLQADYFTYI